MEKITLYMRLDRLSSNGRLTGNYRELVPINDIDKEVEEIKEHAETDFRDGRIWVQRFLLEKEEISSKHPAYNKLLKRVDVTEIVREYLEGSE